MILRYISPSAIKFESKKLYLILNASLGDTFNALLYLCSAPPKAPYELILKKDHLNAASLLLARYERKPEVVNILETQDGNFPLFIMQVNSEFKLQRGFIPHPNLTGPLILWCMPDEYHQRIPLSEHDLNEWRLHFSRLTPPLDIRNNSIIFFRSRGLNPEYFPDFEKLAAQIKTSVNASLYANVSNIHHYGPESIPGVESVSPTVDQLIALAYSDEMVVSFVGLKSGMFDIMRFSKQALVPFYDDHQLLWDRMRLVSMQNSAPHLELRYQRETSEQQWGEMYGAVCDLLNTRHSGLILSS